MVPGTYNGLPVTAIDWLSNDKVLRVTLPDGLITICESAFGFSMEMESINIPASVKTIGGNAFSHCYDLQSIPLQEGLTSIGSYAFNNCRSLTSIYIPVSVTSLGRGVFQNCKNLTTITYGGTVAQWNALEKGTDLFIADWDSDGVYEGTIPATEIICTDGRISLVP